MKTAGGIKESGIVVGNVYNKYEARNPIARILMDGFTRSLSELVHRCAPSSIHEVGCGEGYWVQKWNRQGIDARGSDFSNAVIDIARDLARNSGLNPSRFIVRSIYSLDPREDSADLIVCCEVLEHLHDPATALEILKGMAAKHLIFSVPREPIWRILNLARGKYWRWLGNTPGHVQHWSCRAFVSFVGKYFEVLEVKNPLPWTMLLCRPR